MKILSTTLKNCYGIDDLSYDFEFTDKVKTFAIYAPNARMKTSFAKTFYDKASGGETNDNVSHKQPEITILKKELKDEAGVDLPREEICVYREPDPGEFEFSRDKVSFLLLNEGLRDRRNKVFKELNAKLEALFNALKVICGKDTIEEFQKDIVETFYPGSNEVLSALSKIKSEVMDESEAKFSKIPYKEIFDGNRYKLIIDVKQDIKAYVERYKELMEKSAIFRDGFTDYKASDVAKLLDKNKFFKPGAGHTINLKDKEGVQLYEIDSRKKLDEKIEEEKDKIFKDPELRKKFDAVNKGLGTTIYSDKLREFLGTHTELLPELENIDEFKRKLWISYFKSQKETIKDLTDLYEAEETQNEIKSIEKEAKDDRPLWDRVLDIFDRRFRPPYEPKVGKRTDAILGIEEPIIEFQWKKTNEPIEQRALLENVLSSGEKRAFYILNLIFEFNARRGNDLDNIFIIDDVVDSYDYYNKFAAIEYLKDMAEEENFYLMLLTHNFDFFRSIKHILDDEGEFLIANRTKSGLSLDPIGDDLDRLFTKDWAKNISSDDKAMVACIPLARNLVEYTKSDDRKSDKNKCYDFFTSLVHYKSNTNAITVDNLLKKYDEIFETTIEREPEDTRFVADVIFELANNMGSNGELNLQDKLVLAMATRLVADRFMRKKWPTKKESDLDKMSTDALVKKYKKSFSGDIATCNLLEEVLIVAQGNLHLNSFMYEPLVDVSSVDLVDLYKEVSGLNP